MTEKILTHKSLCVFSPDGQKEMNALVESVEISEGLDDRVTALEEGGGAIGLPFLPELPEVEVVAPTNNTTHYLYQMVAAKKNISVPTYLSINLVLLPDPETLSPGDVLRIEASDTPGDKPVFVLPFGSTVISETGESVVPFTFILPDSAAMFVVAQDGSIIVLSEFKATSELYSILHSLITDTGYYEEAANDAGTLWARVIDLQETVNTADTGLVDRVEALGNPAKDSATITVSSVIATDAVVVNGVTLTYVASDPGPNDVVKGWDDDASAVHLATRISAIDGLAATVTGAVVTVTADPGILLAVTTDDTTITVAYTAAADSIYTAIRVLGEGT